MNKRIAKKKRKQFMAMAAQLSRALDNLRASNERLARAVGGVGELLRSMRERNAEPH